MVVVVWGQQYSVGEKLIVILHTYINRHAGTPSKKETKDTSLDTDHFLNIESTVESDGCQHCYIAILLTIKRITE